MLVLFTVSYTYFLRNGAWQLRMKKNICTTPLNSCDGPGEMLTSIQLPLRICPACGNKRSLLYSACPAAPHLAEFLSDVMWCILLPQ